MTKGNIRGTSGRIVIIVFIAWICLKPNKEKLLLEFSRETKKEKFAKKLLHYNGFVVIILLQWLLFNYFVAMAVLQWLRCHDFVAIASFQ